MSAFPAIRYPIHWGTSSAFRQQILNLCPIERWLWRKSARGTPARAFWRATLKTRQLQLLIFRIGRDWAAMHDRGWLDPDPETGRSALREEMLGRLIAAVERKNRAQARADRMAGLRPKRPNLADLFRSSSPPAS